MKIPQPIITREHGAWAVLYVSLLIGAVYADRFSWNVVYLALAALGVFLSYVPVHTLLRRLIGMEIPAEKFDGSLFWMVVYLLFGVVFIIPLLRQDLWYLILIGIVGMISFFGNFLLTRTIQKSISSDLVAVAGLTLSAPSAYYVTTGTIDEKAVVVWILNFLFFGCSVFYVHMKLQATALKKKEWGLEDKLSAGKLNIAYHLVVVLVVVILAVYHFTPTMVTLAYVPMVLHALYGTIQLHRRVKFKHLGFLLLGQSIAFAVLLLWLIN